MRNVFAVHRYRCSNIHMCDSILHFWEQIYNALFFYEGKQTSSLLSRGDLNFVYTERKKARPLSSSRGRKKQPLSLHFFPHQQRRATTPENRFSNHYTIATMRKAKLLKSGQNLLRLKSMRERERESPPFHRTWSPSLLSSSKPSSSSPSSVAIKQSQALDRESVTAEFQTRFRTDRSSQFQSLNDAAKK